MIKYGMTLQAWGAKLPTQANAEKIFQYLDYYGLNHHLIQHTARSGWSFAHLEFWLELCKKYNHTYILDVQDTNTYLATGPTSDYIIGQYQLALDLCRGVHPLGLRAVCCAKETDWTYRGSYEDWKNYVDSLYYWLRTRSGVPVYVVENGSSNEARRQYMRLKNEGIYITHWFAGYSHCINGYAAKEHIERMNQVGYNRCMFLECGVGVNETATYSKLDVPYMQQILSLNPEYVGFWFAGTGEPLSYFNSNGDPHSWFDNLLKSGALSGSAPPTEPPTEPPEPPKTSNALAIAVLVAALSALEGKK